MVVEVVGLWKAREATAVGSFQQFGGKKHPVLVKTGAELLAAALPWTDNACKQLGQRLCLCLSLPQLPLWL